MTGIYRLCGEAKGEVNALRLARLKDAAGFSAREEVLLWSADDDRGVVLGVREHGALVATQRMEVVNTMDQLRLKLDHDGMAAHVSLPCLVVGKAATAASHGGRGINSLLNALAVDHALRLGVRYVVSTVVADGPRTGFLRSLGFDFIPHPEGWRRFGYRSTEPVVVAVLDLERFGRRTLDQLVGCNPALSSVLERYPLRCTLLPTAC
ncbi:MAG: hypothetical protein ACXVBW_11235 [Bdellovibrionota bacterium]